jgi:GNAT superfamily N-acetyltransferase
MFVKIRPFTSVYLNDAVRLFGGNYRKLREKIPELPGKYGEIKIIKPMLAEMVKKHTAAAVLSKGRLVGYMTGYSRIKALKGSANGVYVPEWAHAVANGGKKDEIYFELYKYMAKKWVEQSCHTHILTYFANDKVPKKLFNEFCFGLLCMDGIRSLGRIRTKSIKGVKCRQAGKHDLPGLIIISKMLIDYLNDSPIFLNRSYRNILKREYKERFFGKGVKTFVAEKNGSIISCIRAVVDEGNCLKVDASGTLGINFGYTVENQRRNGTASMVLNELLKWGRANGMQRCTVDFETQNREGREFWLKYFKPVCYSIMRKVDDRIKIKTRRSL